MTSLHSVHHSYCKVEETPVGCTFYMEEYSIQVCNRLLKLLPAIPLRSHLRAFSILLFFSSVLKVFFPLSIYPSKYTFKICDVP